MRLITSLLLIASVLVVPHLSAQVTFYATEGRISGGIPFNADVPHNHPESALLFETFEGTGFSTAGWTAVTGGGGTVDPDFTSTILDGSQSLEINGPTDEVAYATNSFSAQSVAYGYFIFKITASSPVEDSWISLMRFRDADGATVFKLQTDGNFLRITTGGQSATALASISLNTTYYCWVSWAKNTGSNSEATLAFSTSKVQPTSGDNTATVTNGSTVANDASQIFLGYANDTVDDSGPEMTTLYDYVLIDDVAVPDYP